MKNITLSIVIPVFNEKENIGFLYDKLKNNFSDYKEKIELIFINDGSGDASLDVLKKIALHDKSVKVLSFNKNNGQTAALDAGFKNSRGEIVLTIDSDLQYDPADLVRIVKELEDDVVDIVLGKRINKTGGLIKKFSSRVAYFVRNSILKDDYQDCSLAGYKRRCLDSLILFDGLQCFIPALLTAQGYKYKEIPVNELPRKYGKSKYNIRNRLFKGLCALYVVKWIKRNKFKYKIIEKINFEISGQNAKS